MGNRASEGPVINLVPFDGKTNHFSVMKFMLVKPRRNPLNSIDMEKL